MVAVEPLAEQIGDMLPVLLYGGDCPDDLLDAVRVRLISRISMPIFHGISPPTRPMVDF